MAELRYSERAIGEIDEVVARVADVHLERMSAGRWFLMITEPDGAITKLWLGAANGRRRAVVVRCVETTGAIA